MFFLFFLFQILSAKETYIVQATDDCLCKSLDFGEADGSFLLTKLTTTDYICTEDDQKKDHVNCNYSFGRNYICPKSCLKLIPIKPLNDKRRNEGIKKGELDGRLNYSNLVPPIVLKALEKKYPKWYPVLVNKSRDIEFLADYKVDQPFYFEIPLKTNVSLVFFHPNKEKLLKYSTHWAFYETDTAKLIFEGKTPYKTFENGYFNHPCLAPAGEDLSQIVLSGITMGTSDAASCCGPYYLGDLKKSGPIKILGNEEFKNKIGYKNDNVMSSVIYESCKTDQKLGKFNPPIEYIKGRSNIRKSGSLTAEVVGLCEDNSKAAVLGSIGEWIYVYCQGKIGYTLNTNLKKNLSP